jgi:hypothetical protein
MARDSVPGRDGRAGEGEPAPGRVVREVNVLEDEGLRRQMTRGSLAVVAVGCAVSAAWALAPGLSSERVGPAWLLALALVSLAALPVHELVHAAAFRLVGGPRTRVRFGHEPGMLTTSAVGTVLSRGRFCAVLLAPAVLLSCAFLAVCATLSLPLLGWWLLVLHLAGCTGDLGMAWAIARTREATRVEDCEFGIRLLA